MKDDKIIIKLAIAVVFISLLSAFCALAEGQITFSRESQWPPISSYSDMDLSQLSFEISMMRKDLEYFSARSDPRS